MGRVATRVRGVQGRAECNGRNPARVLSRAHGALQSAPWFHGGNRVAENRHRQNSKVRLTQRTSKHHRAVTLERAAAKPTAAAVTMAGHSPSVKRENPAASI